MNGLFLCLLCQCFQMVLNGFAMPDAVIIQSVQQLVEIVAVVAGIVDFIKYPCDPLAVKLGQNVMQIPIARVREPVLYNFFRAVGWLSLGQCSSSLTHAGVHGMPSRLR